MVCLMCDKGECKHSATNDRRGVWQRLCARSKDSLASCLSKDSLASFGTCEIHPVSEISCWFFLTSTWTHELQRTAGLGQHSNLCDKWCVCNKECFDSLYTTPYTIHVAQIHYAYVGRSHWTEWATESLSTARSLSSWKIFFAQQSSSWCMQINCGVADELLPILISNYVVSLMWTCFKFAAMSSHMKLRAMGADVNMWFNVQSVSTWWPHLYIERALEALWC